MCCIVHQLTDVKLAVHACQPSARQPLVKCKLLSLEHALVIAIDTITTAQCTIFGTPKKLLLLGKCNKKGNPT